MATARNEEKEISRGYKNIMMIMRDCEDGYITKKEAIHEVERFAHIALVRMNPEKYARVERECED